MVRALLLAGMLCAAAVARAETPVDLELVLAVDVSGSIDMNEAGLQRDGYTAALLSEEVVAAITSGPHGRIALAYVEWAGSSTVRTVVDWRIIDGPAAAQDFTSDLNRRWPVTGQRTSISRVIQYAVAMFDNNDFVGTRRIIDISGDGPNNNGLPVLSARDVARDRNVGINGLVILNNEPGPLEFPVLEDLDIYFEECVITGPAAFVLAADGFADFGRAIRRKLVLEIAGLAPRRPAIRPAAGYNCLIGEMQLQEWLRSNPFEP